METSVQTQPPKRALHSQALDLLRFPLALVVLSIHVFPHNVAEMQENLRQFAPTGEFPFYQEFLHFVNSFLRGQSVPIYYFISGFVFFLGIELTREKYLQKLKNRTKTLLIPYLIWNTLALLVICGTRLPIFNRFLVEGATSSVHITLRGILSAYWIYDGSFTSQIPINAPVDGPLWFIRNLMVVVLTTPVLYHLIKRYRHIPVLLLGIMWCGSLFSLDINYLSFITSYFFFSWGAYMSIQRKDMIAEFGCWFKLSMIAYPLLGLLCFLCWHYQCPEMADRIKQLNVIAGLFFAYNLSVWLLQKGYCKPNGFLCASSFFIYISHALISSPVAKIVIICLKPTTEIGIIFTFLVAIVVLTGLCLAAFWFLKRFMPPVLQLLTGRR